jgi:2-oxo-4-hydroxy-4-carboxy--5-ureidoimidazoline (OHCU) decarboxylase
VQQAAPETLAVLAAADQAYQATLGYAFWVCVTGKSTEEVLANLRQRPSNEPEIELRIAAEEQRKIM